MTRELHLWRSRGLGVGYGFRKDVQCHRVEGSTVMHLEETPEQLALRAELRAYFADLLTDDVRHALDSETEGGATFRRMVRQMGTDGWLALLPDGQVREQGRILAEQAWRER